MSKRLKNITFGIIILLIVISIFTFIYHKNNTNKTKVKSIKYISVLEDDNIILSDNLTLEFGKIGYLSDYITITSGEFKDKEIKYSDLGNVQIKFMYKINNKKNYRYINIDIVDTTTPLISSFNSKTVAVNSDISFVDNIFCADNHDKKPDCHIEGDFDLTNVGSYPVKFIAKDSSNNVKSFDFTLNVVEKINSVTEKKEEPINYIDYSSIYNEHKNDNTLVGIDVSKWQGDIDFDLLKENNVEFIMIRLGGQDGLDGSYYIDSKFKQNIEGALSHGMKVGIYFYSYAYTKKEAINQAKYVIENLKDYDISLPIVYDWEIWNKFNKLNLSLFDITEVQKAFLDEVEKNGYRGARYGSKNYLTNAWQDSSYPTWLAHYVSSTTYEGSYFMWQRCNTGKVPGIYGAVDVDILYLENY